MKKTIVYLCITLTLIHAQHSHAAKINKHILSPNSISTIHTAVGYTSLIELSERPKHVVLGDQSAFKVEFLGNNLAIKPLISNVKSNLFIFTETDRYNCTLISGPKSKVDYVVRLEPKLPTVIPINLLRSNGIYVVELLSLSSNTSEQNLSFKIHNETSKPIEIDPYGVNLLNKDERIPISSIFIESDSITPGETLHGRISFTLSKYKKLTFLIEPPGLPSLQIPFNPRRTNR